MTSRLTRTAQLDKLATAHRLIEKGRINADAALNRGSDFSTGEIVASADEDRETSA